MRQMNGWHLWTDARRESRNARVRCLAKKPNDPQNKPSSLPAFRILSINIIRSFVLVLSPKDGTRARLVRVLYYEHEHHFIEHEHESNAKVVDNDEV